MTGCTGTFQKRCVADRIQEALVRAAMRIMTTDTGVGTRLNIPVSGQEFFAGELMTTAAQLCFAGIEHTLNPGAMGAVTLHAIFHRRFMSHSFAPELRHFRVAAEAQKWLALVEQGLMR